MTIPLRDYQQNMVAGIRGALRRKKRIIAVAPTGAGKTRLAAYMMDGCIRNGKRPMFVVHRKELCRQTSRSLSDLGVRHGMILAGKKVENRQAYVGMVATIAKRLDKIPDPDVIFFDEGHRSLSASYKQIMARWPDALVICLTASPQRTDGRGMGEVYGEIVEGPAMSWLIENGYLCDYEIMAPPIGVDLSGVSVRGGDYSADQLQEAMDQAVITGDAVKIYLDHAKGKRCMVFCSGVEHSKHVCDSYKAAGVAAEHIDGMSTDDERTGALERFERGETLVLCSVNLAIEGLDIPAIEVVQWLRPTKSLIIYLQAIGRGLRPHPCKKKLLILDHVNNWKVHGLPDEERTWTLEDKPKSARQIAEPFQCGVCYAVMPRRPSVCACGTVYAEETEGRAAPEVVDGVLEVVDKEAEKKRKRQEEAKCKTLEDFQALARARGYKPGWAKLRFELRQKNQRQIA